MTVRGLYSKTILLNLFSGINSLIIFRLIDTSTLAILKTSSAGVFQAILFLWVTGTLGACS
jgi:hypothetical protein